MPKKTARDRRVEAVALEVTQQLEESSAQNALADVPDDQLFVVDRTGNFCCINWLSSMGFERATMVLKRHLMRH